MSGNEQEPTPKQGEGQDKGAFIRTKERRPFPEGGKISVEKFLYSRFAATIICPECQNSLAVYMVDAEVALAASGIVGDPEKKEGRAHLKLLHSEDRVARGSGRKQVSQCSIYNAERVSFSLLANQSGDPDVRYAVMQSLWKPDVRPLNRELLALLYQIATGVRPEPQQIDLYEDAGLVAFGGLAPLTQHPFLFPYAIMSMQTAFLRQGEKNEVEVSYHEHDEDFTYYADKDGKVQRLQHPAYLTLERKVGKGWVPFGENGRLFISVDAARQLLAEGASYSSSTRPVAPSGNKRNEEKPELT